MELELQVAFLKKIKKIKFKYGDMELGLQVASCF
jgi:hypothetical protein